MEGITESFQFLKRIMECGSVVEEQVEVNFDGISNQIVHVVQQAAYSVASPPNKDYKNRPYNNQGPIGIPAKTRDHIHVDDMTDEEIHSAWYTMEDIKKFKKEKKLARQLRKRRIQRQRQNGVQTEDDSSYSSCSSTSTTSSSVSQKRVSWGISEPTGLVTPEKAVTEETLIAAVPSSSPSPPPTTIISPLATVHKASAAAAPIASSTA